MCVRSVFAGGVINFELRGLVLHSDLIFQGELLRKHEELSIEGIPYTFVTYKVDQIISGDYQEQSITLKYVGGHFLNGNLLSASNTPEVTVGEQAILLVQKSRNTGCDLVECEHGRFLLEDGRIISGNQSSIVIDDEGSIGYASYAAQRADRNSDNIRHISIPQFIAQLKYLDDALQDLRKIPKAKVSNIGKHVPFKASAGLTKSLKGPAASNSVSTRKYSGLKNIK